MPLSRLSSHTMRISIVLVYKDQIWLPPISAQNGRLGMLFRKSGTEVNQDVLGSDLSGNEATELVTYGEPAKPAKHASYYNSGRNIERVARYSVHRRGPAIASYSCSSTCSMSQWKDYAPSLQIHSLSERARRCLQSYLNIGKLKRGNPFLVVRDDLVFVDPSEARYAHEILSRPGLPPQHTKRLELALACKAGQGLLQKLVELVECLL
jgi:hypothetical protein